MQSMNSKITGNTLTAAEWNQPMTELQNCITKAGLALSAGNLNQLGIAIARAASGGSYFMNAAGTADAIELDLVLTAMVLPTAYFRGMHIEWVAVDTNTTNVTITITPIASVKKLLMPDYSEIPAGLIVEDVKYEAWYDDTADGATGAFILVDLVSAQRPDITNLPPNYFSPFILANDATATTNGITIAPSACKDSTNAKDIVLDSDLGKLLTTNWASGGVPNTCTGGKPSSVTITNDTWYYVFAIAKEDGTVNAGFDNVTNAANLMADATVISNGYLYYRMIGAVYYATATILKFFQNANRFIWDVPVLNYSGASTTSATLQGVTCPPNQEAYLNCSAFNSSSGTTYYLFTSPNQTDTTPTSSIFNLRVNGIGDGISTDSAVMGIICNGSSQIRRRATTTDSVVIQTLGWFFDPTL